jgi:hypothetical protein
MQGGKSSHEYTNGRKLYIFNLDTSRSIKKIDHHHDAKLFTLYV